VGTAVFVGAAALAFGPESFVRFFENLRASQSVVSEQLITTPAYASLYGNLIDAGVPDAVALAAQIVSAAVALAIAVWIFFKRGEASGAALCAATLLISPYLFFYDFTLLAVGAALLGAPRDRFELAAIVAAWSAGLSLTIGYYAPVPLCPLAAWLILLASARRGRGAAYPTQRTPDLPRSAQS
jgi:hypothetical protein